MRTHVSIVVVLLACACGNGRPDHPFEVEVKVAAAPGDTGWISAPDVVARARAAALSSIAVWGGSEADLYGYTMTIIDGWSGYRDGMEVKGYTLPSGAIDIWRGPAACIELTSIAHEMGHVAIIDYDHADPRWRDPRFARSIFAALRSVIPQSDTECLQALALVEGDRGFVALRL